MRRVRRLARELGFDEWARAASPIVGRTFTDVRRNGLTVAETELVADHLQRQFGEETSRDDFGLLERALIEVVDHYEGELEDHPEFEGLLGKAERVLALYRAFLDFHERELCGELMPGTTRVQGAEILVDNGTRWERAGVLTAEDVRQEAEFVVSTARLFVDRRTEGPTFEHAARAFIGWLLWSALEGDRT